MAFRSSIRRQRRQFPQTAYDDGKGFLLNLFGKEIKLLPTANGQSNTGPRWTRTFCGAFWIPPTTNGWSMTRAGTVYSFGQTTNSRVANPKTGWSGYSGTFHWGLDQIVTATGDWTTVAYTNYTSPDTGAAGADALSHADHLQRPHQFQRVFGERWRDAHHHLRDRNPA